MTTHRRQIWRLFTTIGGLLTGLFALGVCTQMVQPVFAAPPADITVVDFALVRNATTALGNAPRKVVVQRTAATAVKASAKASIADFAFTPGEITIARRESVSWINDDGAQHARGDHGGATATDPL